MRHRRNSSQGPCLRHRCLLQGNNVDGGGARAKEEIARRGVGEAWGCFLGVARDRAMVRGVLFNGDARSYFGVISGNVGAGCGECQPCFSAKHWSRLDRWIKHFGWMR